MANWDDAQHRRRGPPLLAALLLLSLGSVLRAEDAAEEVELEVSRRPAGGGLDQKVFELEHSLNEGASFSARGTLVITPGASRSKMAAIAGGPVRFAGENATQLVALCYDQTKGAYRLRARAAGAPPDEPWVSTSVEACDLFALGFAEDLEAHVDARVNLLSLSYKNLVAGITPPPRPSSREFELSSSASLALDVVAQIIPIQVQAAKPPAGAEVLLADAEHNRESGEPALGDENRKPKAKQGFFARYWHVIIPVTLIVLTAKGEPPAAAEGQAGDGGAAAGGGGASGQRRAAS